ncbi:hypothetical protein [Desulfocapsa sulfexigens]|nr:hypothetical protein [Desulfocapsa sulfexigens]
MTKNIPELEKELKMCLDMESPSIVLLDTTIEKHFPAKRHLSNPNAPSLDWGSLKKWGEEKGWKVTLAVNNKKIYPGVRFTPLTQVNPIPNSAPNPPADNSKTKHNWDNKPIGKIGIGVVIIIIGTCAVYLIGTHLGINL